MGGNMAVIKPSEPDPNTLKMYQGYVELKFNPKSPKYRYTVTDKDLGLKNEPVRGVTSVLDDIINKKELMTWPLNMSNQAVFGAKFDPESKGYSHD